MKKIIYFLLFLFLISASSFSQGVGVGTNTPDISAMLDITSGNKGLLVPRMSTASINAIISPAKGLLVYDSLTNQLVANIGTRTNPNWQPLVIGSVWNLNGNNGINPANQFIGTKDNQPLRFRINNIQAGELHPVTGNIFWGLRAGQGNTTGFSNIVVGTDALKLNTAASSLIAIGDSALFNNNGLLNMAIGSKSLLSNSTGSRNTALGFQSLFTNTSGNANTATGFQALFSNKEGFQNTANGNGALFSNTSGSINTATGVNALFSNTVGFTNTATGFSALFSNTSGSFNSAHGEFALNANTTGEANTANGNFSLQLTTIGSNNTASGHKALFNNLTGHNNTAIGSFAADIPARDTNNTFIGFGANNFTGLSLTNSTALGANSTITASNQVRFGNTLTSSIGGFVGYSNLSDGRFKKNIQQTVPGIDFIMKLRPVTYQFDFTALDKKLNTGSKIDGLSKTGINENEKTIFSGFVAQEVEQAAKAVGYDFSGVDKPKNENDMYGIRYAEFVVPLVKAVQEQQQMIDELKKQNNTSQQIINELRKRVNDLEKK